MALHKSISQLISKLTAADSAKFINKLVSWRHAVLPKILFRYCILEEMLTYSHSEFLLKVSSAIFILLKITWE